MYYSSQYDNIRSNVSVPIQVPSSGKERDNRTQKHYSGSGMSSMECDDVLKHIVWMVIHYEL